MAAKKKHSKKSHRIVSDSKVHRKKGHLYYVDAQGNVRETKMQRGAKKGHRTCR